MHSLSMKNLSIAAPLVMGGLLVVVYVQLYKDLTDYKPIIIQKHEKKSVIRALPEYRFPAYKYPWPKCRQNISASGVPGFYSLPHLIQDFLSYRHCRHFPIILDIPDKCGGANGSADIFLLLVIKSSPVNYARREVLRKTWAKERLQNGVWIRRIFIAGTTGEGYEKNTLNKLLEIEKLEYNDILQWDFNDTFYNLTLKQVLFLEWMDTNCPNVRFLMNGDDDVLAHTDNMVDYLKNLKDNDGSKHLFTGYLIENRGPYRYPDLKYYVPVQVQETDTYPPYLGGGGFLLSGYSAMVMYKMSHSVMFHPIDDVYIAMCLEKAELRPTSHIGVKIAGHRSPDNIDPLEPCYFKEILLVHRFLPAELYVMWNSLHDPNLKCFHKNEQ
ncbi:N-acetyllactosaminide beta-1,3-N-acetylglucosaminyltransferase 3-like [Amphiprion ocellaris]|uniref:Hexosyltransferase n=1 Tax=Amphiprion ocellaris TaxID=80972 RepID=A0AAQ5WZD7_AMPOC|nr:N-acetyllactosaminide beta-1,3-N-acetylglucosaminyltransferase 3-like [Amphiprion ocellaris]